jgi:hypothetical protein
MSTEKTSPPGNHERPRLARWAHILVELPPDDHWTLSELSDQRDLDFAPNQNTVLHSSIFEQVGTRGDLNTYHVKEDAYRKAKRFQAEQNGLPCCGYTGFRNRRDGAYECRACGALHDRETVAAMVKRQRGQP